MSTESATLDTIRIPRTKEQWKETMEQELHVPGERVEQLATERDALVRRSELLKAIQEANPEMNGEAKIVANTMATNIEQIDAATLFLEGVDPDTIKPTGEEVEMLRQAEQSPDTETAGAEAKETGNMLTRSAKWLYTKTFVEHPYLSTGALALIAVLFLRPAVFNIPALLERMAAQVPHDKIRSVIEAVKKLSPTIRTLPPDVVTAPPNSIGIG